MPQRLGRLDVQWLKSGLLFQRQDAEERHGAGRHRRKKGRCSPLVSALRYWSSFSSLRPLATGRYRHRDAGGRGLRASPPAEQGEPSRTATEGASKGPTNWHKWHTPIADDLVATGNAQARRKPRRRSRLGPFPPRPTLAVKPRRAGPKKVPVAYFRIQGSAIEPQAE
jgi:hypothetical protein